MNSEKYTEFGNRILVHMNSEKVSFSFGWCELWKSLYGYFSGNISIAWYQDTATIKDLDNAIAYNLRMSFNCWDQFNVIQPGLNKVRYTVWVCFMKVLDE